MAYVDLEKCENVLVGDDGLPHLFDFQISWYWSRRWGGELLPLRVMRGWFQRGDRYHLIKLRRRTRPDQLSPEVLAASYRKPWYVRCASVCVVALVDVAAGDPESHRPAPQTGRTRAGGGIAPSAIRCGASSSPLAKGGFRGWCFCLVCSTLQWVPRPSRCNHVAVASSFAEQPRCAAKVGGRTD